MAKARIFATSDGVRVKTSKYDAAFVDDIKTQIPKGARAWDPEDKVWEVMPEYLEAVIEIARGHFDIVDVEEEEYDPGFDYEEYDRSGKGQAKQARTDWRAIAERLEADLRKLRDEIVKARTTSTSNGHDPWSMLRPFMTKEEFKGLYRILAKRYHPDTTTDPKAKKAYEEKMKQLNGLFEKLGGK